MADKPPVVSVVMPAYNSEQYLGMAIESILDQTLPDFELIMVDDGSTDGTARILQDYQRRDQRIVLIAHEKQAGVACSLNNGLEIAKGKYIARMDADDISHPERLEKQVEYLEAHPEVGLLGSDAYFIDTDNHKIVLLGQPGEDLAIRWTILLTNPFFHPTVMMRRSMMKQYNLRYQESLQSTQDYDLWMRVLEHACAANLHYPYIQYRVTPHSVSTLKKDYQLNRHIEISRSYLERNYPAFKIDNQTHSLLVAAFSGRMNLSDYPHRPRLAIKYLDLWHLFHKAHLQNPNIMKIRKNVVIPAAKIGLYPPFQPGWFRVFCQLFREDAIWFIRVIIKMPMMVMLHNKGIQLRLMRKRP